MIKIFCDRCNTELSNKDLPTGGTTGHRLSAALSGNGYIMEVEVITSLDGVWNKGHFCKPCILEALSLIK